MSLLVILWSQTFTLFAQPKIVQFTLDDVVSPTGFNPFVSFATTAGQLSWFEPMIGSVGNNYYIHSDESLFGEHLDLYRKLNLSAMRTSDSQKLPKDT